MVDTMAMPTPGDTPGVRPAALKSTGITMDRPAPTSAKPTRTAGAVVPQPGIPVGEGGGGADGGGRRRRPPWGARCRADPDCLPPRPARVRVGEPALGSGRPAPMATARRAAAAWH